MGDLDGRSPRAMVAVEGEEAVTAELVDHGLHRHHVDVHGDDLRREDTPPAPLFVLGDGDQAQEQLARRVLLVERQAVVQVVSPPAEHAAHPAHRPEGGEGEPVSVAPVEELGQRVLEERECARLTDDVGEQLGEHGGFERDGAPGGRFRRRFFELVDRERQDIDDAGPRRAAKSP